MPTKFSELYKAAWETDVLHGEPIGSPPAPLTITFPSTFNNIALYASSGSFMIGAQISANLRVPGGTNSTYFSNPTVPSRISSFDGLYLGEIARFMPTPVYTSTVDANFSYRPTKGPDDAKSFAWVSSDNTWKYTEYDFGLNSFDTVRATDPAVNQNSDWNYGSSGVSGQFETNTNELGGTENQIFINKFDTSGADLALLLYQMDLSLGLKISQGTDNWIYDITSWVDATTVNLTVTLVSSTTFVLSPTGTFNIEFRFKAQGSAMEHTGYTWGQVLSAKNFYLSPTKPLGLFSCNLSAGTDSFIGFWDYSTTTLIRQSGFQWDQCTIAAIPFEDTTLYPTFNDPYVVATFLETTTSATTLQIMDLSGTITQTATDSHQFVKTIPKCIHFTTPTDTVFIVSYGPTSVGSGITFYEINDSGQIVGTYNDTIGGSIVNQIEFRGHQYSKSPDSGMVQLLASTTNGEYSIQFDPINGTITSTILGPHFVTTQNLSVVIRCSPFDDLDGIFQMSNRTTQTRWINLGLNGLVTHTDPAISDFPNEVDSVYWRSGFNGNGFWYPSAGAGWLAAKQTGPSYIAGSTGSTLSSYKENASAGSQILTDSIFYHTTTWVGDAGNHAVIYGDPSSTNWNVSRMDPISI
jgi:hypothetical protein